MATQTKSDIIVLVLHQDVETLNDRFGCDLAVAQNLFENIDGFRLVIKLAVHLECKQVNFQLVAVTLLDQLAATLNKAGCSLIVLKLQPCVGCHQLELLGKRHI